ncbi:MAG TPA: TIGR04255 family protein [Patescibacteria group bacterium]|nr:TIGR04255 family protein [Patescibacteria group bacterium]
MPFPESARVLYSHNPLVEVISQVRFPPILRIEADPPADFQDAVRASFPVLTESAAGSTAFGLPPEFAGQVPAEVLQQLAAFRLGVQPSTRTYTFKSDDDRWSMTLGRDALSLTAARYERWEEFRDRLLIGLRAMIDLYRPAFFSRVGLRYQDVICRSELGLADVPWSDLLASHIAGELAAEPIVDDVFVAARQLGARLPDVGGQLLLRHGLTLKESTNEVCFLIDADFYTAERTEVADVERALDGFHGQAGRLFRWCIQPRLHEALDPRPITD